MTPVQGEGLAIVMEKKSFKASLRQSSSVDAVLNGIRREEAKHEDGLLLTQSMTPASAAQTALMSP